MTFWTLHNLADAMGVASPPGVPDAPVTGVSIDSRTLQRGELFFAIAGDHFDGHDYVRAALDRGAVGAVVGPGRCGALSADAGALVVAPDTLGALQRLACAHRTRLAGAGVSVIAVGGSNGKTTARHLIHTALSAALTGTQSPKSFNNHLGVPLTLLAARASHDFVVCEIGTNHPGEVASLARIARPDIAVLTSIGKEHLEHFGSLEAVGREERSLLDHMRRDQATKGTSDQGGKGKPTHGHGWVSGDDGNGNGGGAWIPPFDLASLPPAPADFPLLGAHNALYARLALAVAHDLGVPRPAAAEALTRVTGLEGRLQRLDMPRGITVIHDAYNANPDSALAALEVFKSESRKPKAQARAVAILGDMLELGDAGPAEHRALGAVAARIADVVVCIGELSSKFTAAAAGTAHAFGAWSDDLPSRVAAVLKPGDVVLLKGSRGMALERLLPAIEALGA